MKKISFILLSLGSFLFSCNKEDIHNTADKVGISKVTHYATIVLNGSNVISLVKGDEFTDPGAKATAGDKDIPVVTSGSVDNNTVGLYVLTYTATNDDGFSSSATRTVVVIPSDEMPGVDLSGSYNAVPVGSTPGPATISKAAAGVYYTTNCWGNSGAVIPAYFICIDGSAITIPLQGSPYGKLQTSAPGTFSGGLITWSIELIDQGDLIRVKKWQM